MNQTTAAGIVQPANRVKPILVIGLIAGTLDIIAAHIQSGAVPLRMGQFIASGALGREVAFSGGVWIAVLGYVFHYLIATTWAAIFFLLYPKVKLLQRNKYVVGLVFGLVVWTLMNRVVLPLSQIPQRPFDITQAWVGMLIIMFMIGLPISILTHRFYSKRGYIG